MNPREGIAIAEAGWLNLCEEIQATLNESHDLADRVIGSLPEGELKLGGEPGCSAERLRDALDAILSNARLLESQLRKIAEQF
jgi:hypothetical protein